MNVSTKKKQTRRCREQTCGCWGGGERTEWEFGISRCKLLYIEWINNKALLYSTGNYIQYPIINHNGKEKKKMTVLFNSKQKLLNCLFYILYPCLAKKKKFDNLLITQIFY